MQVELDNPAGSLVRSWRRTDAAPLARHANDRRIWRNLRDAFPHPYTLADAREWIAGAREAKPETNFAIVADGEAAGAIGFVLRTDVERVSAEIGYWVGAAHWNRGLATGALRAVTRLAIEQHALTRVYALPFAWNPSSCRVLEKAGFVREGRLRRAAIKDGVVVDQLLYAFVPAEE
jgi:ribosomal-protein-alanine N-acetyltransferase